MRAGGRHGTARSNDPVVALELAAVGRILLIDTAVGRYDGYSRKNIDVCSVHAEMIISSPWNSLR